MSGLKLKLRNNTWYANGTIKTKRIVKSSGFSKSEKEEARHWMLRLELELLNNSGSMEEKPFGKLLKMYRDDISNISNREESGLNIIGKYLSHLKVKKVRTDLKEYIATRHAKSQENSIDRDINGRIRAIINYGRDRKLCGNFEVKVSSPDDTRKVFLSIEKRDALLETIQPEYREFLNILVYQGLRFGQALSLTSESLTDDDSLIVYSKKGQKRDSLKKVVLPLHPKVSLILNERVSILGEGVCLFPEIEYEKYRQAHLKACKELSIVDYRIHDNRKTFASLLKNAAQTTDRESAELLGHSGTRNVYKYSINNDTRVLLSRLT